MSPHRWPLQVSLNQTHKKCWHMRITSQHLCVIHIATCTCLSRSPQNMISSMNVRSCFVANDNVHCWYIMHFVCECSYIPKHWRYKVHVRWWCCWCNSSCFCFCEASHFEMWSVTLYGLLQRFPLKFVT